MKLEELERLCAAATSGPWHIKDEVEIDSCLDGDERYCEWLADITAKNEDPTEYQTLLIQSCGLQRFAQPNAEFMVDLRNAAPHLIAVAKAAKAFCYKSHPFTGDCMRDHYDNNHICTCGWEALTGALAALEAEA